MANLSERMAAVLPASDVAGPRASFAIWWLPIIGIITVALCLPPFRIVFSLGDEGVLPHGALRMLQGQTIYKDFFEFLPPGGFVLTEAWLWLAGISVGSVRTLAVINIVAIACLIWLACRRASGNAPLSAALAILWVILSQGVWTVLSHHWLTTMFSMVTIWAAIEQGEKANSRWPWIAGGAAGIAAMVTPTCGALAMAAALSGFASRRGTLLTYVLASLAAPLMLVIYLAWSGALPAAFTDVIVLTATRYAPIQYVPFGTGAGIENLPIDYVFPAAAVLGLLVRLQKWHLQEGHAEWDRTFGVCAAFALAGLVASFPRPDVFHIAFGVPLACPLLAYAAVRLTARWRIVYQVIAACAVLMFLAPSVIAYGSLARFFQSGDAMPTPRGDLRFFKLDGAPEMIARITAIPPGDGWFFYPFMPMMPFLTGREDVARHDVFTPEYTLPAEYRETCIAVLRRATWVVIDRHWIDPAELKRIFPAMKDQRPRETSVFEQILDRDFDLVAQEGTFELRHRNGGAEEGDCDSITAP